MTRHTKDEARRLQHARLRIKGGRVIYLLKPKDLRCLPDGVALTSILGEKMIKGWDDIDRDVQNGYLAFGLSLKDWKKYFIKS